MHAIVCRGPRNDRARGRADLNIISPVQQLEKCLEVVITVLPAAGHVEKKIDLRRGRPPQDR